MEAHRILNPKPLTPTNPVKWAFLGGPPQVYSLNREPSLWSRIHQLSEYFQKVLMFPNFSITNTPSSSSCEREPQPHTSQLLGLWHAKELLENWLWQVRLTCNILQTPTWKVEQAGFLGCQGSRIFILRAFNSLDGIQRAVQRMKAELG